MKSHLLECVAMQNYEVEVKNHSEVTEVQELFFAMGCRKGVCVDSRYPKLIVTHNNNDGWYSAGAMIGHNNKYKQITIQELRDMVVLKRNDVGDSNVKEENCLYDLYLTSSKQLYFYHCGKNKWILSNLNGDQDYYSLLKPIKKEEVKMKEYLVKNAETGDYFLTRNHSNFVGAIEIPEGANKYIQSIKYPERFGFLRNGSFWDNKWIKHCDKRDDYIVLWQRESLNDKVASAEKARQEQTQFKCSTKELHESELIDAVQKIIDGFTQPEELPFVDDNAWSKQIGGDHYKKLAIQPMEYALQNKLDYAQANVVKYVTRHADKNGKQDLLKAIHNIELMIAHYYSDQE